MGSATQATLLSLPREELEARVVALGGKPFHAKIARENVLAKGQLEYASMSSLPAGLREALARELPILAGSEVTRSVAADQTTKLLVAFPRGKAERDVAVETVHMPSLYEAEEDRKSVV